MPRAVRTNRRRGGASPDRARRGEPRPLPEFVSETPAPASGARPDAPHVRPASYVAVPLLFSALVFGFFRVNQHGLLQDRRQRLQLAKMQAEVAQLDEDNRKLES